MDTTNMDTNTNTNTNANTNANNSLISSQLTALINKEYKTEVYDNLRTQLFTSNTKTDGSTSTSISDFVKRFVAEAVSDPTSKAANILAKTIFKDNLLELLDSNNNAEMNKNREFSEYRLIKQFYDKQRDIILDCNKFKKIIAITSRRTGKTTMNAGLIVYEALTPKSNITYINLTFTNAVSQIFDLVVDYSDSVGLGTTFKSKSEGIIRWTNGSQLKLAGNSNNAEADKLRGFNCRLAIIDEIGHQRNIDYLVDEILIPQMVDYSDSTLLLTGTPSRIPMHFSTRIFTENNQYKKYHFTMLDNPFIPNPRQFIENEAADKGFSMDSPFIRREYFGEIVADTEALVFKDYKTYKEMPDLTNFNPIGINIGGDYGYKDYNGIVTVIYNKEKAYVLKEDKFNKANVSKIIDKMMEHYNYAMSLVKRNNWNIPVKIYADYNEESITKELMVKYKVPAFNCYKYDKAYAIEKLSEMVRTGKLLVPENGLCADEMDRTLYDRDDKTDAIISELSDSYHPDILMALLYASRRMFYDMGLDVKYKMQDGEEKVEVVRHDEEIKKKLNNIIPTPVNEFRDIGIVG